jgi:hypothetical protein
MKNVSSTVEELTAYLDGELAPDQVQQVEQRLASDSAYLAEMQTLQQTWDLFERMPAEHGSDAFVKTTMELIVQDATSESRRKRNVGWSRSLRPAAMILIPLLVFGLSFFIFTTSGLAPHRQLVEDLMLIENLDRYAKVDSDLDFLVQLEEWGLFAEDKTMIADAGSTLPADLFAYSQPGKFPSRKTIEERREHIERLDLDQKQELKRNYDEYTQLPLDKKTTLRAFHNRLTAHPNQQQLSRVLGEFYEWLKTLGLAEQARLLDLSGEKQLIEIARIKSRQARETFGRSGATQLPSTQDAEFLFDWYELTLNSHEQQIRNQFLIVVVDFLKRNGRDVPAGQLNRFARRQPLNQLVAIMMRINRKSVEDIMLTDVDLLRRGLSTEARLIFDQQSQTGQRELLLNWIDSANQSGSTVSPERLQEFYETLSVTERDVLDKMAPENWIQSLTQKYWENQNSQTQAPKTKLDDIDDWQSFLENNGFETF